MTIRRFRSYKRAKHQKGTIVEKRLRALFEYQRFQRNSHLASLIEETEEKYSHELSDDDLELVNAAGDMDNAGKKKPAKPGAADNE